MNPSPCCKTADEDDLSHRGDRSIIMSNDDADCVSDPCFLAAMSLDRARPICLLDAEHVSTTKDLTTEVRSATRACFQNDWTQKARCEPVCLLRQYLRPSTSSVLTPPPPPRRFGRTQWRGLVRRAVSANLDGNNCEH